MGGARVLFRWYLACVKSFLRYSADFPASVKSQTPRATEISRMSCPCDLLTAHNSQTQNKRIIQVYTEMCICTRTLWPLGTIQATPAPSQVTPNVYVRKYCICPTRPYVPFECGSQKHLLHKNMVFREIFLKAIFF